MLAERFLAGDETAFAVLYERHRASVLAVCIGVLGSRDDAEDATQETFATLAVSLRDKPPRELRPWLARVARNAAIDLARRRRIRGTPADEIPEPAVAAGNAINDELESVMAGIRELPESQRSALLLRELAGYSYQEIAVVLEIDERSVRGLIARARIGLRTYREATELSCATARAALATEPDGRPRDKTVRRHIRGCASCRSYQRALRADSRALRGVVPTGSSGFAGGGALVGGLAAKGAVAGGVLTQLTAACAVSVCAVGGIVLLAPHAHMHGPVPVRGPAAPARSAGSAGRSGGGAGSSAGGAGASAGGVTVGRLESGGYSRSAAGDDRSGAAGSIGSQSDGRSPRLFAARSAPETVSATKLGGAPAGSSVAESQTTTTPSAQLSPPAGTATNGPAPAGGGAGGSRAGGGRVRSRDEAPRLAGGGNDSGGLPGATGVGASGGGGGGSGLVGAGGGGGGGADLVGAGGGGGGGAGLVGADGGGSSVAGAAGGGAEVGGDSGGSEVADAGGSQAGGATGGTNGGAQSLGAAGSGGQPVPDPPSDRTPAAGGGPAQGGGVAGGGVAGGGVASGGVASGGVASGGVADGGVASGGGGSGGVASGGGSLEGRPGAHSHPAG